MTADITKERLGTEEREIKSDCGEGKKNFLEIVEVMLVLEK